MGSTAELSTCARWCRSTRGRSWVRSAAPIVCSRSRKIRACAVGAPRSFRSSPTKRSMTWTAPRSGSRPRTFRCRPPTFWKTRCCRASSASPRRCDDRCRADPVRSPQSKEETMYDNLLANVPTDLYLGGKWRKSSDNQRFDVIDPATEKTIASVASASVEDAKAAVDAASTAMEGWAARKPRERAEGLRKAFELISRDTERFAKLMTIENGKALPDSRAEVAYAAEFFRWYAEEAVRNIGEVSRAPASGARMLVQHKPAGVAVLVTPWNFPAAMAACKP